MLSWLTHLSVNGRGALVLLGEVGASLHGDTLGSVLGHQWERKEGIGRVHRAYQVPMVCAMNSLMGLLQQQLDSVGSNPL